MIYTCTYVCMYIYLFKKWTLNHNMHDLEAVFYKTEAASNIEVISLAFHSVEYFPSSASQLHTCHLTGDAIPKKKVGRVDRSAQTTPLLRFSIPSSFRSQY